MSVVIEEQFAVLRVGVKGSVCPEAFVDPVLVPNGQGLRLHVSPDVLRFDLAVLLLVALPIAVLKHKQRDTFLKIGKYLVFLALVPGVGED